MKRIFGLLVMFTLLMAVFSCHRYRVDDAVTSEIDSLNTLSYHLRYKDLSKSASLAEQAYQLAAPNYSVYPEVLNNMGFCAYMKMDFEKSMKLFTSVVELSDNEVECLVADVGLMKICQRTSSNKEFYDYRNRAQRRIKRIKQDKVVETDSVLSARFNYALSEFHITSGVYFYYLQQEKESLSEIDAINVDKIEADTAQFLYYMYMRGSGGMYSAATPEEIVIGEFGYLMDCLRLSHDLGYTYFEANSLQAMAEILNFRSNRNLLLQKRKGWLELVNEDECPVDSLPLNLAERSLKLFREYGDWYQISGAYRTMATYYNYTGTPERALPLLDTALQFVNKHHEKYYACTDTTDRLKTYIKDFPYSLELKWINNDGIKTVPEWIARLREQLSRTYSAMGMKPQSDYNRNIYLDILDYTRQDKELESRYAALDRESYLLNILLLMVVLGFFILAVVLILLNKFWRIRNNLYIDKLNKVLLVCRNITAAVPEEASGPEDVVCVVEKAVRLDVLSITGSDDLWIELLSSENDGERPEWVVDGKTPVLDMTAPGKNESVGRLWLKKNGRLRRDELSMMRLITPYMAWTLENGLNLMMLADTRIRLEQEEYIHRMHIADNKRQNEMKKACVAIVNGIVPYIDRVINEVKKLRNASFAKDDAVRNGKLQYIDELLSKINDYNDILAVWIKMKQGDISLNIENFGLDSLFSVIAKGKHAFEIKKQTLNIHDSDLVVKADKALTLFMINTLAENARKYTPAGGEITLSAVEGENYVEVSVKDNGPGLSSSDVDRILKEKVYDSGSIGMETASNSAELAKQKGHGFGLMNCKGIIDKYKKTSPVFSVCTFGIESEPGKGSRFYFRLPKGVRKVLSVIALLVSFSSAFAVPADSALMSDTIPAIEENYVVTGYDSLLAIANTYANMVYESNVRADYQNALTLADSAFHYMNMHYLKYSGRKGPLLDTNSKDDAPELVWLSDRFDTDYYIILDIRNEVAVASLAVKNFSKYYYNNKAYTTLYKQISEDKSLEQYCQNMQKSANNKMVAIMLFVVLIVVGLVAYYVIYLRRMLHYRYNMEQVLTINQTVFSASVYGETPEKTSEICSRTVDTLFRDINELITIENLVIGIFDEADGKLEYSWYSDCSDETLLDKLDKSYIRRSIIYDRDKQWFLLPLRVDSPNEVKCIGVIGLRCDEKSVREEDRILLELVSEYLGVALYHTIVQVEKRFQDIELAKDETARAEHEENTLHVQNLVLDNCLSTIKHETIYYPGRLRKIVEEVKDGYAGDGDARSMETRLGDMDELVTYYKEIFTLLSSYASRMLDGVTFRRSFVNVSDLMAYVEKYYRKSVRRMSDYPDLRISVDKEYTVVGDEILLRFMFENLIDEALRYNGRGEISLYASAEDGFARFDFIDRRRNYTQQELNLLFYPDSAKVRRSDNGDVLSGAEYLICKQIIRDHDEFAGRRGCRINAKVMDDGKGFSVWFTVPLKNS